MNIDILSVGNATMDVFIMLRNLKDFNYDKFANQISFPLGNKVPLDEYELCLGGNACNVSVGLSRLGLKTALAAEIAEDEFSDRIINALTQEKVDQSLIRRRQEETPHFNIVLSYEGERTILEEKKPHGPGVEVPSTGARMIYLTSLNTDWQKSYDEIISANGESKLALNPGSRQINENKNELLSYLSKIEILFVNLQEAQKLIDDTNPDVKVTLGKLKELGVKNAVVTDGRTGSYGIDNNGKMYQLGVVTDGKPLERTGAGDSYAAAFMYAHLSNYDIKEAMRFGAINADNVIQYVGAQKGLLTKEEIEKRAKELTNLATIEI
jgi:sugar/nucleoside kinase (ribokinase family)